MSELTNSVVQKLIHKTLDPIMKAEGFSRTGRTYCKEMDGLVFILTTAASSSYFSAVTGWPSHAFSVYEGIWIDGICPGILGRYPKKKDKNGIYIPEAFNCIHITQEGLKYGINRIAEHPYLETVQTYGVTNKAEINRRDLWVMPDEAEAQAAFLEELKQQVIDCFLCGYQEYIDISKLEHLILDGPRQVNAEKGFADNQPFSKDNLAGNFHHYLDYAVLFHQRYGPEDKYLFYLNRIEQWAKLHKRKIPACYYCGYGIEFKL